MHPLLSRQRGVFGLGRAGLRLEPQLGVLLHEGPPVLAIPAALAVAGVRAEKVALEALAVAARARTTKCELGREEAEERREAHRFLTA
jgi:hypothetical protein